MSLLKTVCIVLYIAAYYVKADKYTDENRPYEFGFTIEGEQHRHEKKDENGIIMGEFGFITADGVYHVTVYATDENGNFKILSMKNIRVKPYPTAPTQNLRQGHSLELPSSPQTKTTIETNNEAQHIKQNSGPAKTCSHCSVPTTTTSSPKFSNEESVNTNNQQKENQYNTQIQSNGNLFSHEHNSQQNLRLNNVPQNINNNQNSNQKPVTVINKGTTEQQYSQNLMNNKQPSREINTPYISSFDVSQNNPPSSSIEPANFQNYPQSFENNPKVVNAGQKHSQGSSPLSSNTGNLYPQTQEQPGLAEAGKTSEGDAFNSDKYHPKKYVKDENLPTNSNAKYGQEYTVPQNSININRQPKSFNEILDSFNPENEYNIGSPQSGISNIPKKPILLAAQMQIVDKNTNIYQKNPGEKDGLPNGLTRDDMKHLLYTFNYTLGFHGHHEEGYTNGAKYGYYFVTGRNGIRTRVDYIADETGFHPKISQEVLDVLSDEVPKPETEKDDKYGLKGYEFKWLFYPVDSS